MRRTKLNKLAALMNSNNVEVFHVTGAKARTYTREAKINGTRICEEGEACHAGWYYWSCLPGCLPDSDFAFGPFTSATRACEDAIDTFALFEDDTQDNS